MKNKKLSYSIERPFKLENEPEIAQISVHLNNLRATFTSDVLAHTIATLYPELTSKIKSIDRKNKLKKIA